MDRLNGGVRRGGEEAVNLMRPRDRLRLRAVERRPDASKGEQRSVLIEREPKRRRIRFCARLGVHPERHLQARNVPNFFTHLGKSLKSQQMRPPAERTKRHKSLVRKVRLIPTLLPTASVRTCSAQSCCFFWDVVLLPSAFFLWSSQLCLNDAPASENSYLLRREQGRGPA